MLNITDIKSDCCNYYTGFYNGPQIMSKDGEWVPWDGSDVGSLIITETITMAELKVRFPEKYKELKKQIKK